MKPIKWRHWYWTVAEARINRSIAIRAEGLVDMLDHNSSDLAVEWYKERVKHVIEFKAWLRNWTGAIQ